jgi:carboxyl-terminal processing protease
MADLLIYASMIYLSRFALITAVAITCSVTLHSQSRVTLDQPIEPFSLKPGSSFSASGGDPNRVFSSKVAEITADIREAEELIRRNQIDGRVITAEEQTASAMDGALRSLDPHSNFFSPSEWNDLMEEERSGYTGMGATIANFSDQGVTDTYILSTFPGSAAERAHLRFGDKIVAIDGQDTTGESSDTVRDRIRGAAGTVFRLTLLRASTKKLETVEIKRGRVPQPSIPDAYILRPGVGYIDLSEGFNYTTALELDSAMQGLKRAGMRSLVLDLRGNGGGIVDQAVKVAERFLPAGTLILTQQGRARIDNRVWRSTNSSPENMPLVVLVDENTASASEIVAGAFQDNDRALIVGEKTFGKGLVQSVIDLPGNSGLTLTAARYLTPSGRSIQRDYTKVDLYDYYNHKAAAIDKPYFEARTLTDRPVFGGDGILPDESVKSDTITDRQAALLDPLFYFAAEVMNEPPAGRDIFQTITFSPGKRIQPGDIVVTDDLLSRFYDFARRRSAGRYAIDDLTAESAFIRLRLRYNLVMASHGPLGAAQVLIENDPQIARALAVLPRAAQLAKTAAQIRRTRSSW